MTTDHVMNDIIARLIERADAHREADEYIAGTYGDLREWEGGCAIGCSIFDLVQMGVLPATTDTGDHAAIAEVTGIPEQLLQLEDAIFEGLPDEDRPAWPGLFLRAAHGRDLAMAWPKFALWLLSGETSPMHGPAQDDQVREAIAGVAGLYREWVDTKARPPESKWAVAWLAAGASARDATRASARDAARTSAAAGHAAWASARDAARTSAAAVHAARASAAHAARASAEEAAWRAMADRLIEIMEGCDHNPAKLDAHGIGRDELTFSALRGANVVRCEQSFPQCDDWAFTDWACAAAGEMGEACNLITKLRRGEDIDRADIGKEIADVVIYLDLLAHRLGLNLGWCVASKFDEVSMRVGSPVRLLQSHHPTAEVHQPGT